MGALVEDVTSAIATTVLPIILAGDTANDRLDLALAAVAKTLGYAAAAFNEAKGTDVSAGNASRGGFDIASILTTQLPVRGHPMTAPYYYSSGGDVMFQPSGGFRPCRIKPHQFEGLRGIYLDDGHAANRAGDKAERDRTMRLYRSLEDAIAESAKWGVCARAQPAMKGAA